jgi:transposase
MKKTGEETMFFEGPSGVLPVKANDKLARQFTMLIDGQCMGLGPTKAAKKYGFTKQRYFQLLRAFEKEGSEALIARKTGPKKNYVRTEDVVKQIVRHCFLDPDANADVIAQKLKQTGAKVSKRSVERTMTEFGLEKKTRLSEGARRITSATLKRMLPKSEPKPSK